jgi:hypothetical protein
MDGGHCLHGHLSDGGNPNSLRSDYVEGTSRAGDQCRDTGKLTRCSVHNTVGLKHIRDMIKAERCWELERKKDIHWLAKTL